MALRKYFGILWEAGGGESSGCGAEWRMVWAAVAAAILVVPAVAAAPPPPESPNVLFIAIDDLNHWVGHLGRNPQAMTPNLDRLAARGLSFSRAYCAAPACNPSRAALMSGLRPDTTGVYYNRNDWRPVIPERMTLPTHFRRHGYYVAGAGKIYHGAFDRPREWDAYFKRQVGLPNPTGKSAGVGAIQWMEMEEGDAALNDFHVVGWTIEQLQRSHDQPFFLACGIFRPHLPWNVPKKYFKKYPLESIALPPYREDDLTDIPREGVRTARPGRDHAGIRKAGLWREAVRAYLASISFADAQLGRLLDALDASTYRENTIIVLWADHGWHLGEKHHWRKFALWEEATRAPLLWVVPGVTEPATVCHHPVDFMSVYPTLAEVCGLPIPKHVEGPSLLPLLKNPQHPWPHAAITTYGRGNHAVRQGNWRYIRYVGGDEELYHHTSDPFEWNNLAGIPRYQSVKTELSRYLP